MLLNHQAPSSAAAKNHQGVVRTEPGAQQYPAGGSGISGSEHTGKLSPVRNFGELGPLTAQQGCSDKAHQSFWSQRKAITWEETSPPATVGFSAATDTGHPVSLAAT